MYLVYVDNDFCVIGREYFIQGENKVLTTHNPNLATQFKTQKEAKSFSSTFTLHSLKKKIATVAGELKRFEDCDWIYREIPLLNRDIDRPYGNEGPDQVLDFWLKHQQLPEGSISYENYATWPDLYSVFKYLWTTQGYHDMKDYSKTYHTVQIRVPKDGNYEDFKKEIEKILDHITYTEDGYKILPIIDHELSTYESRSLYYKSEDDCMIGGRFPDGELNLKECFEIMKRMYYYE